MTLRSELGSWLWARASEWADELVVAPLRAHIDQRVRELMTQAGQGQASFDAAMTRFADVQQQGFANLRTWVTKVVNDANASGDQARMDDAARLDAGIDALAAGFAQLATAANADPSAPSVDTSTLPPVQNPDTPVSTDTNPDALDGAPLNPVDVVEDPDVATPADPGSPQPGGSVAADD